MKNKKLLKKMKENKLAEIVMKHPSYMSFFKTLTEKDILSVIEHNPDFIRKLEKDQITQTICNKVIEKKGKLLYAIPEKFQTKEIINIALKENLKNFIFVVNQTEEMVLDVLKKDIFLFKYINRKFLENEEFVLKIIDIDKRIFMSLPKKYHTQKIREKAIELYPQSYEYIDIKNITPKMTLQYVSANGLNLAHVCKSLITFAVCMEAVKENGLALQYVPFDKKEYDLAIKLNVEDRFLSPKSYYKICQTAIKQNKNAIRFVIKSAIKSAIE